MSWEPMLMVILVLGSMLSLAAERSSGGPMGGRLFSVAKPDPHRRIYAAREDGCRAGDLTFYVPVAEALTGRRDRFDSKNSVRRDVLDCGGPL
jgi:hypothetical protein